MSDYGDVCREVRDAKRAARAKHGVPCPECQRLLPKASPSILLPQQRCKIHGYRDQRPRESSSEYLTRWSGGPTRSTRQAAVPASTTALRKSRLRGERAA